MSRRELVCLLLVFVAASACSDGGNAAAAGAGACTVGQKRCSPDGHTALECKTAASGLATWVVTAGCAGATCVAGACGGAELRLAVSPKTGGAGTTGPNGVSVVIPPGAVAAPITVVVTATHAHDAAPVVGLAPTVKTGVSPHKFEPDGTLFAKPVLITLPVAAGKVTGTRIVPILWFDETQGVWTPAHTQSGEVIAGISSQDGTHVTFATDHFSSYAVGDDAIFFAHVVGKGVLILLPVHDESPLGAGLATWGLDNPTRRRFGYHEILLELATRSGKARAASEIDLGSRLKAALLAYHQGLAPGAAVDALKLQTYILKILSLVDAADGHGLTSTMGKSLGELGSKFSEWVSLVTLTEKFAACVLDELSEAALYASLDYARAIDRWEAIRPSLEASALAKNDPAYLLAIGDVTGTLSGLRDAVSERFGQALVATTSDCKGLIADSMAKLLLPWIVDGILGLSGPGAILAKLAYEFILKDVIFQDLTAAKSRSVTLSLLGTAWYHGGLRWIMDEWAGEKVPAKIALGDTATRQLWDRRQMAFYAWESVLRQIADALDKSDTSFYNKAMNWLPDSLNNAAELAAGYRESAEANAAKDGTIAAAFSGYCDGSAAMKANPLCSGAYPVPLCTASCKDKCAGADNGCQGKCPNPCTSGFVCVAGGACLAESQCGDITSTGVCNGQVLTYCAGGTLAQEDCAKSGMSCGWNATYAKNSCVTGTCVPKCAGKQCGDDGCGGWCGSGPCSGVAGGMVLIPAGSFKMGCVPGDQCGSSEGPQHTVTLDAYYMDAYEVTVAKYKLCVDAGTCTAPSSSYSNCDWGVSGREQHPVNCVDWTQADIYCKWTDAKGHLPTEAEWEKAARGGLSDKKFPWGDEDATCDSGQPNTAVYWSSPKKYGYGCETGTDWEVGTGSSKNGFGLYDVAGNVWEWVSDWYGSGYYGISVATNPQGPSTGSARVFRGGSYFDYAAYMRSSYRFSGDPVGIAPFVGFRCAKSYP